MTERTPSAMSTLMHFEGGNALAPHQIQALLPKLQAINPRISGVHARFVHWVALDKALPQGELDKLAALLPYGDAYDGVSEGDLIVVAPRLGTVSPWASKATDIAHICGLPQVRRIERGEPSAWFVAGDGCGDAGGVAGAGCLYRWRG